MLLHMAENETKSPPWKTLRQKAILDKEFLKLFEKEMEESATGRKSIFYTLHSKDWCNITPITEEGRIVMIRQYRFGADCYTLEIPGGIVDPEDPDPKDGALRELFEETGYRAADRARCLSLGSVQPNPAILNNLAHSYIVGPVRRVSAPELDEHEAIETLEVTPEEIPARIASGEIRHALTIANLFAIVMLGEGGRRELFARLREFSGSP